MAATDRHVAGGPGPFEIERWRQRDIAFAAGVQIGQRAIAGDRPAEHAHIGAALADLERRQQLVADLDQLQQARVLVVRIQFAEVVHEGGLRQEAALGFHRHHVVAFARLYQPVQPEHVFHAGLGLQPQENVVTEQQQVGADLHDVAAHAVVLAADAEAAGDLQAAVAEFGQALLVERIGQAAQAAALVTQPAAQHFIGTPLGNGLVDGGGGFRRRRLGTLGGIRHRLPSGSRTTGRTGRPVRGRRRRARGAPSGAQRASTTVADTVSTSARCWSSILRGLSSRGATPR